MFWNNPYNSSLVAEHCALAWGVPSARSWIAQQYGGRRLLQGASNIVFSSGSYDGWSSAGVATNVSSKGVVSFLIQQGAHHLDLMFSDSADPPFVIAGRELELGMIKTWIQNFAPIEAVAWGDLL
jgi:lysosomal Pro-X carboxypeptidase